MLMGFLLISASDQSPTYSRSYIDGGNRFIPSLRYGLMVILFPICPYVDNNEARKTKITRVNSFLIILLKFL